MQSTLEAAPATTPASVTPAAESPDLAPLILRPTGVQTFLSCPRYVVHDITGVML